MKIVKDSKIVAKIVIIDKKNRVLLLKRSKNHKKFPEEMDLPGGHLNENEPLLKGLEREVDEETGLKVKDPVFYKTEGNKHFFYMRYDSSPIKLSHEHTSYGFFGKKELKKDKKFEKIALEVLEMIKR